MKTFKDYFEYVIRRKNNKQEVAEKCHKLQKGEMPLDDIDSFLRDDPAKNDALAILPRKSLTECVSDKAADSSNQRFDISQSNHRDDLIKDLIDLIYEYDAILMNVGNDEIRQIIESFQYRIIEVLIKNGFTAIESDALFDHSSHMPVPYAIIKDGTPIKGFIRAGLRKEDIIYLKAQVAV